MSSPSFTVLFPEALRTHKQEYFQTEVSSTQLVGVQSLGPEQRLHEVMPEKQTGLAWAGTLAGVLRSGSAPPRTRWFASEGSCWCWQGWEVAPQPSTPCTGQRPWVRRLPRCMQPVLGGATGHTEKEGTCPWGMTCDQGSHGRRMTGMLTRCWAELKLTERDMRNCWTRHEKNIGFNK